MIESDDMVDVCVYFIKNNSINLRVGSEEFPVEVLENLRQTEGIIIWENQGLFRIFSSVILRNLISHYEVARNLDALFPRTKSPDNLCDIYWSQGIDISQKAVKALLTTEESLGDPDTTTDTTGEDHTNQP